MHLWCVDIASGQGVRLQGWKKYSLSNFASLHPVYKHRTKLKALIEWKIKLSLVSLPELPGTVTPHHTNGWATWMLANSMNIQHLSQLYGPVLNSMTAAFVWSRVVHTADSILLSSKVKFKWDWHGLPSTWEKLWKKKEICWRRNENSSKGQNGGIQCTY